MNRTQKTSYGATVLAAACVASLAFTSCSAPAAPRSTVAEASIATSAPTTEPTTAAGTAAPPPERSAVWGTDEQIAVQTEWCRLIDASWDAYFGHGNGQGYTDLAMALLQKAGELEPASFGAFEVHGGSVFHTRAIDRDIHFIGGGVDSQYIEYTTNGCWDWADALGADLGDKGVDPLPELYVLAGMAP